MEVTYYIKGLFRQSNAQYAREYLEIEAGAGTGTVTNTSGNLTLNQVVVGNGGADIKVLPSPGDATMFLNGAATPAFAQVKDSDLSLTNITANNVTTLAHGFCPILTGNESDFLDGTGNFSNPTGGMAIGWFRYDNNTTIADPGAGDFRMNTASWGTATVLAFDQLSDPGNDVTAMIMMIRSGDQILIQKKNDSTIYGRFSATATPTNNTGWFSVPVTNVVDSGVMPANTQLCAVVISYDGGGGSGITELTGDVTAGPGSGSQAATIPNNTVTYAKMQDVSAASRLVGRGDSGSGDPQEITLGTGLAMTGTVLSATSGSGTVTNTGTLTDHGVIVGNGGVDVSALAVGATNTVLHGVTGADPSFSAVVEADITLADNTTNNASTSNHGFLKKLSNVSTEYMDGTGNWSVPAGTGAGSDWISTKEARIAFNGPNLNTFSAFACQLGSQSNTLSAQAASASQLDCAAVTTNATTLLTCAYIGSLSAISSGGDLMYGRQTKFMAFVTPVSNTNARHWCGVTNVVSNTMAASDTPTGNYACFRYSTVAADTNWQAVVGDGSSNEVIDTGVAVSNTDMVRLEVRWDGSASNSFDFYINGSLVATGTLNPASTTLMHFFTSVSITLAGTAKNFRLAEMKSRTTYP